MPATEIAETGSTPVDPEDDGFLTSPAEALENYADLLTEGEDSEFTDQFAEEPFRELVQQEADNLASNVEAAGQFDHENTVQEDHNIAIGTADWVMIKHGQLRTRRHLW